MSSLNTTIIIINGKCFHGWMDYLESELNRLENKSDIKMVTQKKTTSIICACTGVQWLFLVCFFFCFVLLRFNHRANVNKSSGI